MHNTATLPAHQRLLRTVQVLLTLILLIKLAGFFTWSEDVGVTRILKTGSRVAMTLAAAGVSQWLQRRGRWPPGGGSTAWPCCSTGFICC